MPDVHDTAEPLEIRRRRALFRAQHRGTKEMDWLLGRYAAARLETMDETAMAEFEQFLSLPDPELQQWLMTPEAFNGDLAGTAFAPLIDAVRAFHGLDGQKTIV